jgi:hypothetical protein
MTVRELISRLQEMPQDVTVMTCMAPNSHYLIELDKINLHDSDTWDTYVDVGA